MTSLEEIGALLGFVAFVGLAVLVFLTFQQARHLRRLRDWAGRAPERAAAIAAREAEPGEETEIEPGIDEDLEPEEEGPRRLDGLRTRLSDAWAEIDRRSPADPRLLLGGLAAIVLGLAIATSGFGLLGSDSGGESQGRAGKSGKSANGGGGREKPKKATVAVLNGTAPPGGTGVPGVADQVSQDVRDAGFKVGAVDNAGSFTTSVVMFTGDGESDAQELAGALISVLGSVEVQPMTPEVEALSGDAEVALIVGQDDAGI